MTSPRLRRSQHCICKSRVAFRVRALDTVVLSNVAENNGALLLIRIGLMAGSRRRLSHKLSSLLRHRARDAGLTIGEDGYVPVSEIMVHFQHRYSFSDIEEVVAQDQKQRYHLTCRNLNDDDDDDAPVWFIRANQGHTIAHVRDKLLLERLTDPYLVPVCIHGTYLKAYAAIEASGGLSRMKRNHIHFAPADLDTVNVQSGLRSNVEVKIYINVSRAMEDGIVFYRSANNVILTPGALSTGTLAMKYFQKVIRVSDNINILAR